MRLHALLSQVLVAFTIEFDNEAERRMPHRTSNFGGSGGRLSPWLVSMAMWFNCIRFVGERSIGVQELERLAGTRTNLRGLCRWGYVKVTNEQIISATAAGQIAYRTWKPLFDEMEERWQTRFGAGPISAVRSALGQLVRMFSDRLPDSMPIVAHGQRTPAPFSGDFSVSGDECLPLAALLAKVLLRFTLDFESESRLSLPVCANVLRLIPQDGIQVRLLPEVSGIATEAIDLALRFLQKYDVVTVGKAAESRFRVTALTERGQRARDSYAKTAAKIEQDWNVRYGERAVQRVRESLQFFAVDSEARLLEGVKPYPDNWRAQLPERRYLPHQPVVTHRGAYPDGS